MLPLLNFLDILTVAIFYTTVSQLVMENLPIMILFYDYESMIKEEKR